MKYLLILLFTLFSAVSYAEEASPGSMPLENVKNETYLCTGEMATGFHYNESSKHWEESDFETRKYLVSKSAGYGNAWEVKEVGESRAVYLSQHDFSAEGKLYCDSLTGTWGEFKMNRNNLRFIRIFSYGYDNPGGSDSRALASSPFVEIGKCAPL